MWLLQVIGTQHINPIDLARPKENINTSGFMPIERDKIDLFVSDGWVDTFRLFHEEGHAILGGLIGSEQGEMLDGELIIFLSIKGWWIFA